MTKKQNLIFIHGFRGSNIGLFDLAEKYFSPDEYNVYIPNLPPAGHQTMPEYSARFYARFVADYIKKHHIEKPILIGHSMGSIIVAATAERYADLIGDRIVFLAPISMRPSKLFANLAPLSVLLPNKLVTYITTKYLYTGKDKQEFREILAKSYHSGKDYQKRIDIYKSAKFSSSYCIDDFYINKKMLFLAGSEDKMMPLKKTTEVALSFGVRPTVIEGAGHLLNFEQPKKVAAIIKRFLKD